jgi:hypothetical protein
MSEGEMIERSKPATEKFFRAIAVGNFDEFRNVTFFSDGLGESEFFKMYHTGFRLNRSLYDIFGDNFYLDFFDNSTRRPRNREQHLRLLPFEFTLEDIDEKRLEFDFRVSDQVVSVSLDGWYSVYHVTFFGEDARFNHDLMFSVVGGLDQSFIEGTIIPATVGFEAGIEFLKKNPNASVAETQEAMTVAWLVARGIEP